MSTGANESAPVCTRAYDSVTCGEQGKHLCQPRVDHVLAFFAELLVHTKGRWARRRFVPTKWQREQIITPLFGRVVWSQEFGQYVRQYKIAWIEVARKNGKSELLAGFMLYLLIADGEESAEIYGCAGDKEQARKVYDVAKRMMQLSDILSSRLRAFEQAKRMVDETTASYYEIVAADAGGNLGHNPHGIAFDEVLTQKNRLLWDAMRTGMGARTEPLMIAATTAGDNPQSFAKLEHDEMQRIADDPDRAPHVFVFLRNLPMDADPWDEANWFWPNPALSQPDSDEEGFLSLQALREEAAEAKNDPAKENSFRQFRLNQWVSQATRWMPMHLWDDCAGEAWTDPELGRQSLGGRAAYGGFDLSSKRDLTAFCLLIPPAGDEDVDGPLHALWRFWLPEDGLDVLDRLHDHKFSRWRDQGWLRVTEGAIIDYDQVIEDIKADASTFKIDALDCDEWSMFPVINRIGAACGLSVERGELVAYRNTFDRISGGMDDLMAFAKAGRIMHHGNPLARFCFDAVEVKHAPYDANLVRPVKPQRETNRARIDAVPAAAMAANAMRRALSTPKIVSAYETRGLMVV